MTRLSKYLLFQELHLKSIGGILESYSNCSKVNSLPKTHKGTFCTKCYGQIHRDVKMVRENRFE